MVQKRVYEEKMKNQYKQTAEQYNKYGKLYHKYRVSGKNFFNSYVDMPTVLSFLKNVRGKKILDIGCGSGLYAKILKKRGAKVHGIDISKTMTELAKKEVPGADFRVGSILKLPFKKNSFDIAISALMLDYVKDYDKALKEVHRILKPKGIYIFSIGNPLFECRRKTKLGGKIYKVLGYSKDMRKVIGWNYFKEGWIPWKLGKMRFKEYRLTMESRISSILKNGFSIEGYKDAKPVTAGRRISPSDYRIFSRLPIFCAFKLKKK